MLADFFPIMCLVKSMLLLGYEKRISHLENGCRFPLSEDDCTGGFFRSRGCSLNPRRNFEGGTHRSVRRSRTVSCVLPILGRTEGEQRVLGEIAHAGRLGCPVAGASTGLGGFWHSLAGFWLPWQRGRSNDR